jgi:hypothetical protein
MKKVLLVFEKHCTRIFDISTEPMRLNAYLKLFKERKKEGLYGDLASMRSQYYFEAGDNNALSAIRVINAHNDYEYERVDEREVEDVK